MFIHSFISALSMCNTKVVYLWDKVWKRLFLLPNQVWYKTKKICLIYITYTYTHDKTSFHYFYLNSFITLKTKIVSLYLTLSPTLTLVFVFIKGMIWNKFRWIAFFWSSFNTKAPLFMHITKHYCSIDFLPVLGSRIESLQQFLYSQKKHQKNNAQQILRMVFIC